MLIIRFWPCSKCTLPLILLRTALNLKACTINNASGASAESKKVGDISKAGWGGSPEERLYDVSRGQNRFVTRPLLQNNNIKSWYVPRKMVSGRFCTSM